MQAMGYVIAVHLPFAGMALLPVLFGWPTILYPTHIVFSVGHACTRRIWPKYRDRQKTFQNTCPIGT